jgi:hypothetical protein
VSVDEVLARFVLQRSHVRADRSLKPDLFIPHPYGELSVTRHGALLDGALWAIGSGVAAERQKRLVGRADVRAGDCLRQRLQVIADPLPYNEQHANVAGWPREKPAQKIIALELAAAAGKLIPAPETAQAAEA